MHAIRQRLGYITVAILSLIPVVLWVDARPLASRFLNATATITSIGQLAGLIGMALFAVVLILSGRFSWMESFFGGMDRLYRVHHVAGGLALVILLIHPLALATKLFLYSPRDAALFLLPGDDLAVNFGRASLILLIGLIVITLYVKLAYGKWKRTHQYMGLSFFLAGLHAFLIPSDVSRSLPLRIYILSLSAVALLVFLYRTVLGSFLVKRYRYAVSAIHRLSESIVEVELKPVGKHLRFIPGQFAFVRFQSTALSTESHPFTIASSKQDEKLRFAIHALGDGTGKMHSTLTTGAVASVEGPFGQLMGRYSHEQVWIGGGVGTVPFLSMARSLTEGDAEKSITLFYCTRNEQEAVFLPELETISARHPRLRIISHCSSTQKHLTATLVREVVGGFDGKHVFICGSPGMVNGLAQQFRGLGLPRTQLHAEGFALRD